MFLIITEYIGPPKILLGFSQDVHASVGSSTSLYCYVQYDFRHTSAWKRDGVYIESMDRYTIRIDSRRRRTNMHLDISEVRQEDFGNYTCEAENQFGKISHVVQLLRKRNWYGWNKNSCSLLTGQNCSFLYAVIIVDS